MKGNVASYPIGRRSNFSSALWAGFRPLGKVARRCAVAVCVLGVAVLVLAFAYHSTVRGGPTLERR